MKSKKILIVEDDQFSAEAIRIQLESIGFKNNVIKYTSDSAIKYFEEHGAELVLMDINLSDSVDGIQVAEQILLIREVPVIFMTASKEEATWNRAKLAQPFAYLLKPFETRELQASIEMALYKFDMERKLKLNELLYRTVVDDQTELIWRFNSKDEITFTNKSFRDLFSVDNGFTKNRQLSDLFSGSKIVSIKESIKDLSLKNPANEIILPIETTRGKRLLQLTIRKLPETINDNIEFQVVAKDVTEEAEIQKELKLRADFYKRMFDEGLTAIFITSLEGKLIDCNNKFLELYGFPSREIAMQYDLVKLYPKEKDRIDLISIISKNGMITNLETPMTTYDGRDIYVLSNMIGVFDYDNKLVQFRGYEIDITDLKIAERALIESEEQSRALFQGNTDPIFISDLEDKCVALNPAFTKLFGYTNEELYGKKFPGHFGIDEGKLYEWVELCRKGSGVSDYETIRRTKDGTYIPVSLSVSPIKDSTGDLRLLSFWYRDISERKHIEAEKERAHAELEIKVRERTAELRAMYDQSPIGMCIFDSKGNMLEINEAFKNIWNIKKIDRSYNIFADPFLADSEIKSKINAIFQGGGDIRLPAIFYDRVEKATPGILKDKWLKHTFYSIYNEEGFVDRIINLVEDVSETKRADEISERYKKQRLVTATIIETLEQERKRLSKEIHDGIGQMLTAAKLGIELFEKETKTNNKNLSDAKNIIYNVGSEVENLINALRPTIFDNYGLIRSVEIMCQEFSELTGIEIKYNAYDFSERLNHNLELNLYRIIQEAVSNITKHSKASKASVQLFNRGNTISVIIEDNGVGFDNGQTSKRNTRKPGFGLVSMIERTELLDGKVHIETASGKGTEIHVDIPLTSGGKIEQN
nr:PAS domain S-box protein [uncultured Sphaerochaeta sp.]